MQLSLPSQELQLYCHFALVPQAYNILAGLLLQETGTSLANWTRLMEADFCFQSGNMILYQQDLDFILINLGKKLPSRIPKIFW